jgi:hypothetical protein
MPTYHPTGAKVQLFTANLASTTTAEPERKKAAFTTQEATRAERNLKNGTLLSETPIACCGEDTRLHFLGLNKEVPFFMIHVGSELYRERGCTVAERLAVKLKAIEGTRELRVNNRQPSNQFIGISPTASLKLSHEKQVDVLPNANSDEQSDPPTSSTTRSNKKRPSLSEGPASIGKINLPSQAAAITRSNPSKSSGRQDAESNQQLIPQALGLLITLTSETFLPSPTGKQAGQDIKIDVFFNGEFTECIFVPGRWSGENSKSGQDHMIHLISGKRIQRLVERPWVVVPPSQNADGSMRTTKHTNAAKAGPHDRWEQIGEAMFHEAEVQGFNEYGDCTQLGSYLASLSRLEMPKAVEALQRFGGPKFGVIDVIITVGTGKKGSAGTYYLSEPTRLEDDRFKHMIVELKEAESGNFSSSRITR